MKNIRKIFGGGLRDYSMVIALVALTIIFNIISGGKEA